MSNAIAFCGLPSQILFRCTVVVCLAFQMQIAHADSEKSSPNPDQQSSAVKRAARYVVEHTAFPVTTITMGGVLTVEVYAPIWNGWSPIQQREFVDGMYELATTGGGMAIPIEITAGGSLVARSVLAQDSSEMIILKERVPLADSNVVP